MNTSFFNYHNISNQICIFFKHPIESSKNWIHEIFKKNYANQDVILFFTAKHDPYLALSRFPKPFLLRSLSNSGKIRIIKKTVSSIKEMNQAIGELKNQNANIKGIWINAHGEPRSIALGDEKDDIHNYPTDKTTSKKKGNRPLRKLARGVKNLDKNAFIVLESCKTGKNKKESISIAQSISNFAPGITVFASTRPIDAYSTTCRWVTVEDNGISKSQLKVTFKGFKPLTGKGLMGCIANICYIFVSAFGFCRMDSTVEYVTPVQKVY